MLPALHGLNSLHVVYMIRRDDTDGIDIVTHLVKHHSEVSEPACIRKGIYYLITSTVKINIAKGDWLGSAITTELWDNSFGTTANANTG